MIHTTTVLSTFKVHHWKHKMYNTAKWS